MLMPLSLQYFTLASTIVAFDMSDALVMDNDEAYRLCGELNRDKEYLASTGYTEFEVIPYKE